MKKNVWLAVLMAAALAGAWQVVRAQDDPAPKGDGDKPALCHGMNNGGEMGMGPMGRLREKLGLTDEQATQIKDLFKKQMESNQPLRDQMKIDMDTLQQKVDMKASDGDLKKLLDKLDGEQKQMQASREKMKDQLRAILTPAQQAKFVLGMKKWGGHMQGKMGKGGHGWGKQGKKKNGGNPPDGNSPASGSNGGDNGQ